MRLAAGLSNTAGMACTLQSSQRTTKLKLCDHAFLSQRLLAPCTACPLPSSISTFFLPRS